MKVFTSVVRERNLARRRASFVSHSLLVRPLRGSARRDEWATAARGEEEGALCRTPFAAGSCIARPVHSACPAAGGPLSLVSQTCG